MQQKRLIAANMIEAGYAPVEIARVTGADDQSVRRWRRILLARGREGLMSRKPTGRQPKLTAEQLKELPELLLHEPKDFGYDAWLWTTQLIARLIQDWFGVSYHADHVGVLLRGLGWSCQKPACRARERDEVKIQQWREQVWPALKKKRTPREASSSLPTRWDS